MQNTPVTTSELLTPEFRRRVEEQVAKQRALQAPAAVREERVADETFLVREKSASRRVADSDEIKRRIERKPLRSPAFKQQKPDKIEISKTALKVKKGTKLSEQFRVMAVTQSVAQRRKAKIMEEQGVTYQDLQQGVAIKCTYVKMVKVEGKKRRNPEPCENDSTGQAPFLCKHHLRKMKIARSIVENKSRQVSTKCARGSCYEDVPESSIKAAAAADAKLAADGKEKKPVKLYCSEHATCCTHSSGCDFQKHKSLDLCFKHAQLAGQLVMSTVKMTDIAPPEQEVKVRKTYCGDCKADTTNVPENVHHQACAARSNCKIAGCSFRGLPSELLAHSLAEAAHVLLGCE